MTHPGLDELIAKFREARREAEADMGNPEQLKLHRELAEACPAFTQNLLFLAWRLLRSEEPERPLEDRLAEIQRLLELAVLGSYRSAPAVVELGYFLDTYPWRCGWNVACGSLAEALPAWNTAKRVSTAPAVPKSAPATFVHLRRPGHTPSTSDAALHSLDAFHSLPESPCFSGRSTTSTREAS